MGTAPGDDQIQVTGNTATGYTVNAKSKSGATFTITKNNGTVPRSCDKRGNGACKSDSTW